MSCKKRVRHTGTTNRVDTRLDHSPAGALAHALQTLGCPAVIRSVSRSALAPKSGASTAKASQATRDAPHPASGAREHSRCARDSVLPWVGRSMMRDFTRRAAGLGEQQAYCSLCMSPNLLHESCMGMCKQHGSHRLMLAILHATRIGLQQHLLDYRIAHPPHLYEEQEVHYSPQKKIAITPGKTSTACRTCYAVRTPSKHFQTPT